MGCPHHRKWLSIDWRCTSCMLILLNSSQDVYLLLLPVYLSHPLPRLFPWSCDFMSHTQLQFTTSLSRFVLVNTLWAVIAAVGRFRHAWIKVIHLFVESCSNPAETLQQLKQTHHRFVLIDGKVHNAEHTGLNASHSFWISLYWIIPSI